MTLIYIIRIWLKQLQMWRSPNIWVGRLETQENWCRAPFWVWVCRPENQESQRYKFQFKPWQAGEPRKNLCFILSLKAGKINVPAQGIRQEWFPPSLGRISLFVLLRLSVDWMRLPFTKVSNLLSSVYQFKCSSHPKTLSQHTKTRFDAISEPLMAHKMNHHDIRE